MTEQPGPDGPSEPTLIAYETFDLGLGFRELGNLPMARRWLATAVRLGHPGAPAALSAVEGLIADIEAVDELDVLLEQLLEDER